jgi:Major capsid protein Gp23
MLNEELLGKWKDVLDHEDLPQIKDPHKRATIAQVLENTEWALAQDSNVGAQQFLLKEDNIPANFMGASSSTQGTGGIDIFDPILISLVRRAMPNLIAYDICGVQPMTGPTGLIFALRSRQSNTTAGQTGPEQFYNEVDDSFSSIVSGANTIGQKYVGSLPGNTSQTSNLAGSGLYNFASAMATAQAEALGTTGNAVFAQMAFSIEKVTVTAKSRALKAEYTMELAQDLKAVHGLDAETELSNILSTEILAEINREVLRTINVTAKPGSQTDTTTAGIFDLDTDANGRWSVEKFKGLMYQLERECNQIAKDTRRGKGNMMICSSDVASALNMAGVLSYTPALNSNNLQVDDTGNTFVGVLNGRIKVYIDPYAAGGNYATVGYRGASAFDAGLFYCPYVPLQMVRAVDQESFAPKIGFKTRYGMVANPFAQGLTQGLGALVQDSNVYYRRTIIVNLM